MDDVGGQVFYVGKSTGTFADQLLAFGWAQMVAELSGGDVNIQDAGPGFEVRPKFWDTAMLENAKGLGASLTFLETKSAKPPAGFSVVAVYDKEREKETALILARKNLSKRAKQAAPDDAPALPPPPHVDLPLFKLINQMSALPAYNEVVRRWYEDKEFWPEYVRLLATYFSKPDNDLAAVEADWKRLAKEHGIGGNVRVTATQIMNPTMGKGGDAVKANNIAPGNKDSFWLLEYLKFVGAKIGALPMVVQGVKDRKTYVPVPVKMSLDAHKRLMSAWRTQFWVTTAIKLDVLAGLTYCREFVRQWRSGNIAGLESYEPGDFAAGFAVAFYKDMGSALALLNLTQINLPNWSQVRSVEQATLYLDVLEEHIRVVRSLDESHSDEYHLLQVYRDFLSGHDLEAFYEFTAGYAHHLMSNLIKNKPIVQFTTNNLEVLVMGHESEASINLEELVKSPGFRNIATAIRLSTIVPQQQKARKQQPLYEVRYGLGDELKRKSAYKDELAQALGDFVQSYNQETVQKLERSKQMRRKLVTTADLDQVLSFIRSDGDSKTVGSLLIAYGYARDIKEPAPTEGNGSTEAVQAEEAEGENYVEMEDKFELDEE
jgi:hypothetical protein